MQKDSQHEVRPEPPQADDTTILQSNLFGSPTVIAEPPDPSETPFPPLVRTSPLTDLSSLAACALPYRQELMLRGKSTYTVTCCFTLRTCLRRAVGVAPLPVGAATVRQIGSAGSPPACGAVSSVCP